MITKFVEATNYGPELGGMNWGKFMVGRFTEEEWGHQSEIGFGSLIGGRGWDKRHLLVLDLQTGEGAIFLPGGFARADLEKHKIWVCPMFKPFLEWLYKQDLTDLSKLPALVKFTEEEAPSSFYAPRNIGREVSEPAEEQVSGETVRKVV
jgi:hypothetical protein